MNRLRSRLLLILAVVLAVTALPQTAHAWRHWGWGPGIYLGIAPPIILGPPVYYAAPPYYGSHYARPAGEACYAGPYVCPLDQPGPLGAPCSCPTNGGRAGGRIG